MKRALILSLFFFGVSSFTANAAQMLTKEEVSHYKLEKIGTLSVDSGGKEFSMPSDLQSKISKEVDSKGGKYYVITSVRESNGGLSGTVTFYK